MKKNLTQKKLMALLLAGIMIFLLAACGEKENQGQNILENPEPVPVEPVKPSLHLQLSEWPVVDGALAMIPYYEEMTARILDLPIEEARKYVLTSNTPLAYQRLVEGKSDIIFCAPPSDEQNDYAYQNHFSYEFVPVLNSGFVFFVNKDNPVNSLTSAQLHDIYAGKITNWKEVGGRDEKIIAYQRADGSGSQTGLYEHVIPKEEVKEPLMEQKIGEMGAIIDAVAHYENSAGAIGFSFYYYVTNMHYEEDVKLIAIDNIFPNEQSISTGAYPFISETCAVFDHQEPEDSVVRMIAQWCASEEGMAMAKDLGYVPNKEQRIIKGYGNDFKFHDAPAFVTSNNLEITFFHEITPHSSATYSNAHYAQISGLKDKTIEDSINKEIKAIYDKYMYDGYIPPNREYPDPEKLKLEDDLSDYCDVSANINNILSVYFNFYQTLTDDENNRYHSSVYETLNFDLRTGKQLTLKDILYYPDNSFEYMNSLVYQKITKGDYYEEGFFEGDDYFKLAAPFTGIKEDQKFYINDFGQIVLVFDYNNPEFVANYAYMLFVDADRIMNFDACSSSSCLFEDEVPSYRFLSGDFESDPVKEELYNEGEWMDIIGQDRNLEFYYEPGYNVEMTDEMIAAAKGDTDLIEDLLRSLVEIYDDFSTQGYTSGHLGYWSGYSTYGSYLNIHQNYYRWTSCTLDEPLGSEYEDRYLDDSINLNLNHLYDLRTGKELQLEDIFVPGTDIMQVLKDGFVKYYRHEIGDEQAADVVAAHAEAALNDMTAFGISGDGLTFDIANLDMYNLETSIYMSFNVLPFRYIGCENLTIFNAR